MLIKCNECGGTLSSTALFCPHCGYVVNKRKIPQRRRKKLPNGFGSIKKLSGSRSLPYAAYPPTKDYYDNGTPMPVKAIGYFKTYNEAYQALSDYNKSPYDVDSRRATFKDVYELFLADKFCEGNKLSKSSERGYTAAFKNCSQLHERTFATLKKEDFQEVIDSCPLKYASKELIRNLFKQMSRFALAHDYIIKDYAQFVTINTEDDDEKGVPLSVEEIHALIQSGDVWGILMLYTGIRIGEIKTLKRVNDKFFRGGVKTNAGKNRLIPIHPMIADLKIDVSDFVADRYRKDFKSRFPSHTPHDLRHTTTWLMQTYGCDDLSTRLILGHSLGGDIEKNTYGHRTEEQLYETILKIPDLSLICH